MPGGVLASYIDGLYRETAGTPDIAADNIDVWLWGDASAATDFPSEAELQTIATNSYTTMLTDWGSTGSGAIFDLTGVGAHAAAVTLVFGTTATASVYVVDANDTTMTAPTAHAEDKDLVLAQVATPTEVVGADYPVAYFDLGTKVQPNGQDIIVTWNASGLFQFGATTA